MKIAILGTGMVGNTIGIKLIRLDHHVMMGSRTAENEKAKAWVELNGTNASHGTFGDAVKFADIIFLCTKGEVTLDVLQMIDVNAFKNKTVIDVSNPLDFSRGMPPSLIISNTNSLGEEVQKLLPDAYVVKSLNIVNCEVMVNPKKTNGDPTMFLCGNNSDAKILVKKLLQDFGWNDIIDLGDITGARAMEMMLPIWLRIYMATQNGYIGFKILR